MPATIELLEALQRDAGAFAALIGGSVPAGWPEFPEAIGFTIAKLRERPDEAQWWMHLFLGPDGRLVGSGGFVGPPVDGVVEIGYEIAPEFRGCGYATAAAMALVAKAAAAGVQAVIAHTLNHDNESTAVLKRLGFGFVGEVPDGDEGSVWQWRRAATAC